MRLDSQLESITVNFENALQKWEEDSSITGDKEPLKNLVKKTFYENQTSLTIQNATISKIPEEAISFIPNLNALYFIANPYLKTLTIQNLPALKSLACQNNHSLQHLYVTNFGNIKKINSIHNTAMHTIFLQNGSHIETLNCFTNPNLTHIFLDRIGSTQEVDIQDCPSLIPNQDITLISPED